MIGFGVGGVADGPRSPTASASSCRWCSARSRSASAIVAAGHRRQPAGSSRSPTAADRARQLGHVRPADRRHLALVHAPARHRGRASAPPATISPARSGRRSCSTSSPATAGARPISASALFCLVDHAAARRCCLRRRIRARMTRPRPPTAAGRAHGRCGLSPGRAAGAARRRRRGLLRRHVDAAGAHRRLLRRPRLRRRARRRDALGDARLRHRQPPRLGLHRRPHRRAARRCCSARCCRASRCCSTCRSTGSTSLYVISALFGLFQGGIVPSYAIIVREYFPPQRSRHARRPRADGDTRRHGARRLDVGRDLRPDRLLPGRLPQRHRPGTCSTSSIALSCCAAAAPPPALGASAGQAASRS